MRTPAPSRSRHRPLRVVVWNIDKKPAAWPALERLQPDICLLNEAVVPDGRRGVWNADGTRGRDRAKRPWTAAVVTNLPSEPITGARPHWRQSSRNVPFECSRPGSWAAASVDTDLGKVSCVSLYGLMDELSDSSVHRSLSELSPILDDPAYKRLVIVGGDLNTGTQWSKREQAFNLRDRNVLDRMAALGLHDCILAKRPPGRLDGCPCLEGDLCTHVRTRRDRGIPSVPYQTDYLFASAKLFSRLLSCEVKATEEWFRISDHAPIVAEFSTA